MVKWLSARRPLNQPLRKLDGQTRLANPTGADDRQQPARRVTQTIADLPQLPLAPDKRREGHGQIVWYDSRTCLPHRDLSCLNLPVQGRRLLVRSDAQLLSQSPPTNLVLRQSRGALAAQGQHAHQLPLRLVSFRQVM